MNDVFNMDNRKEVGMASEPTYDPVERTYTITILAVLAALAVVKTSSTWSVNRQTSSRPTMMCRCGSAIVLQAGSPNC